MNLEPSEVVTGKLAMDNREKENRFIEEIKRCNRGLIEHVDHQFKALAEQYGSLREERSREIGQLSNYMEQRFDIVEMAVRGNSKGIKELRAGQEDLKTDVKELKTDVQVLKSDVKELQMGQERLEERQERLEEGQSGLRSQVERIEHKLDTKLTDHEGRIVKLEDKAYI